ncbi:MAG TPA: hypothetical protein VML54_08500 [Candidatus Limnocylindrales bacterium]|nr:hypothetical protein [Candidatus Limnocylindrales bacterium]
MSSAIRSAASTWSGRTRGRTLYELDPDTLTFTTIVGGAEDPGTPPYAEGSGTWGRFAHDPARDVYLLASRVTGPVLAFKGSARLHGTYTFAAGTQGAVQVAGSNGQAAADAVRFVLVP